MNSPMRLWAAVAPGIFVLLWSTGFIGARLGLPHAEPFIFLLARFSLLAILLAAVGMAWRAPWPTSWAQAGHLVIAGLLIHGTYLGGVFWAISHGTAAAVAALIVGIQPLLTAVGAGPYLGEKVTLRQWLGLIVGFVGISLVVGDDISFRDGNTAGIVSCVVALIGITAGTLYQKKHGGAMDLRTGSAIQFAAPALVMLLLSLTFEEGRIEWTGEFIFAITWLIFVLSIGAMTLLYLLIRQGSASKVASLFYLVPPVVAVEAYYLFDETMSIFDMVGMFVTMAAVALVLHTGKTSSK